MRRLATVLLLAHAAYGQPSVTCPKLFKDSPAPGSNFLPAARTKGFIQTWYHGENLPVGMVVTQLGWRYDPTAWYPSAFAHRMEIVLDNATTTFATLSSTFANNLSATPTTFLPLGNLSWPAPPSGGSDPAMWIPGHVPFQFTGPHLLVQVDIQTEENPRTLSSLLVDSYFMSTGRPFLGQSARSGCAGSRVAVEPMLNGSDVDVGFRLAGGPSNSSAVFMLGADNQALTSANILPIGLGFLGMTGCTLGINPLVYVTVPTDATGRASLQGSLPNLPHIAQSLFAQCVHSGNTPFGLVTTNVAGAEVGVAGLSNYVYNWTIFSPTSEFGPYPTNCGAVISMR